MAPSNVRHDVSSSGYENRFLNLLTPALDSGRIPWHGDTRAHPSRFALTSLGTVDAHGGCHPPSELVAAGEVGWMDSPQNPRGQHGGVVVRPPRKSGRGL